MGLFYWRVGHTEWRPGGPAVRNMWVLYLLSLSGVCICCVYPWFLAVFVFRDREERRRRAEDLLQILINPT